MNLRLAVEEDTFITLHKMLLGRGCQSVCHVKDLSWEHVVGIQFLLLLLHLHLLHEASLTQFTICMQSLSRRSIV